MSQLLYRRLRRFGSFWLPRLALAITAFGFIVFVLGRQQPTRRNLRSRVLASCLECSCNCHPDFPSISSPGDTFNASFLDSSLSVYTNCGKDDPEMSKEMEKDISSLLSEEISLQKVTISDNVERAEKSLMVVKILSSHYQKEAEKCTAGTVTCEEARERSTASLVEERRLSELWEQRARELGWKDD